MNGLRRYAAKIGMMDATQSVIGFNISIGCG